MTDRLLKAIANPNTSLIGHPAGRLLLRRDAYSSISTRFSKRRPTQSRDRTELPSHRLDLSDVHLRLAKQHGVKVVINTDSHHTSHLEKMHSESAAPAAWISGGVLNTLPVANYTLALNVSDKQAGKRGRSVYRYRLIDPAQ